MTDPYAAPTADLSLPVSDTAPPRVFALKGRIGRLRYLAYGIGIGLIASIPMLIGMGIFGRAEVTISWHKYLWMIPTYIATVILAVRRLSDIGNPKWLAALVVIPYVYYLMGLYLVFWPGDKETNADGPPPPPNSTGVIATVCIFPAVAVIGIVAAIAIPAYQTYTTRAHQSASGKL